MIHLLYQSINYDLYFCINDACLNISVNKIYQNLRNKQSVMFQMLVIGNKVSIQFGEDKLVVYQTQYNTRHNIRS